MADLMILMAHWPSGLGRLAKLEGDRGDKDVLGKELEARVEAMSVLIRKSVAAGGKVKNFKPMWSRRWAT